MSNQNEIISKPQASDSQQLASKMPQNSNALQSSDISIRIGVYQDPLLQKKRYQLLSGYVQPREDGNYPFYEEAWLVPHETIRVLTKQIENALVAFNGSKAWKVKRYFKYYNIYLRVVHDHHENEEKIFFPNYKAYLAKILSEVPFPEDASEEHGPLINILDEIMGFEKKFLDLISTNSQEEIRLTEIQFKEKVTTMSQMMNAHLDAEERTIAPIIQRCGQEFLNQQEQKILEQTRKEPDQEMIKFFIGILLITRCDQQHGWGTNESNERFLQAFPWIVRKLILPRFRKLYLEYHQNLLDLNFSEEPIPPKSFCCF